MATARDPCPAAMFAVAGAILVLQGCALSAAPREAPSAGVRSAPDRAHPDGGDSASVGTTFESEEFLVTFAMPGDTPERLAARLLGDPGKAWVIEDYNALDRLEPGQEVVIPKTDWNRAGVDPTGYQLVPILVYHNIGPRSRGRLVLAVEQFTEQMQYLKQHGYRVVALSEFCDFVSLRRQLPRKAVVLSFDDGYRSFLRYAYPVLKELGFTATLFVYTDYVGTGHNALTWEELRRLVREGFDVQAHSKTHSDLRRKPGESAAAFRARMESELGRPRALFRRHVGRSAQVLAYPYGAHDEELIGNVEAHGYTAAFDVHRVGNPSFVYPLRAHRTQVYSTMSLEEFASALDVYRAEPIR